MQIWLTVISRYCYLQAIGVMSRRLTRSSQKALNRPQMDSQKRLDTGSGLVISTNSAIHTRTPIHKARRGPAATIAALSKRDSSASSASMSTTRDTLVPRNSTGKAPTKPPAAGAADPFAALYFPTLSALEAWLDTAHDRTPSGAWLQISKKGSALPSVSYAEAVDAALCFGWIDGQRLGGGRGGAPSAVAITSSSTTTSSSSSTSLPHPAPCPAHPPPDPSTYFLQRFTPRRAKSIWSARNVARVVELEAAGRMRGPGAAEVDKARADGRWDKAYKGSADMEVPADFAEALDAVGGGAGAKRGAGIARAFFENLTRSQRYSFLWRIETAKTDEARRKKITQCIGMLVDGKIW